MTRIDCRSGGGLFLTDRSILDQWRAMPPNAELDFAELLAIAVDPTGRTDQVDRWTDENWQDVWQRETLPLVGLANSGLLAVVVFQRGGYHCDLEIMKGTPECADAQIIEQQLYLPTGMLVIAELGKLAEDWEVSFEVKHDSFSQTEVEVGIGWKRVSFIFPRNVNVDGEGRRRIFGSPTNPFCIIRCVSTSADANAISELPVVPTVPGTAVLKTH